MGAIKFAWRAFNLYPQYLPVAILKMQSLRSLEFRTTLNNSGYITTLHFQIYTGDILIALWRIRGIVAWGWQRTAHFYMYVNCHGTFSSLSSLSLHIPEQIKIKISPLPVCSRFSVISDPSRGRAVTVFRRREFAKSFKHAQNARLSILSAGTKTHFLTKVNWHSKNASCPCQPVKSSKDIIKVFGQN